MRKNDVLYPVRRFKKASTEVAAGCDKPLQWRVSSAVVMVNCYFSGSLSGSAQSGPERAAGNGMQKRRGTNLHQHSTILNAASIRSEMGTSFAANIACDLVSHSLKQPSAGVEGILWIRQACSEMVTLPSVQDLWLRGLASNLSGQDSAYASPTLARSSPVFIRPHFQAQQASQTRHIPRLRRKRLYHAA